MNEAAMTTPFMQGQHVVVQRQGATWWYDYETLQKRLDMAVKYPVLYESPAAQETDIAILRDATAYLRENLTVEAVIA